MSAAGEAKARRARRRAIALADASLMEIDEIVQRGQA
jgi:hypothetical protein